MSRISLLRGEILIRTLNEQTPRSLGCNRGVLPAALMGRSHGASGSSGPYLGLCSQASARNLTASITGEIRAVPTAANSEIEPFARPADEIAVPSAARDVRTMKQTM